jgi:hypothetical protein
MGVTAGRADNRGEQCRVPAVACIVDENQFAAGPGSRQVPRRAEQVDEVQAALD